MTENALEIVVLNPGLNYDIFRDYSYDDPLAREIISGILLRKGITPITHPKVVDLGAGDGSFARMFCDNGWGPTDITCIDWQRTTTPLVKGVNWYYWDLEKLGFALQSNIPLPPKVVALRQQFDIVVLDRTIPFYPRSLGDLVTTHFVKPGGYVFSSSKFFERIP